MRETLGGIEGAPLQAATALQELSSRPCTKSSTRGRRRARGASSRRQCAQCVVRRKRAPPGESRGAHCRGGPDASDGATRGNYGAKVRFKSPKSGPSRLPTCVRKGDVSRPGRSQSVWPPVSFCNVAALAAVLLVAAAARYRWPLGTDGVMRRAMRRWGLRIWTGRASGSTFRRRTALSNSAGRMGNGTRACSRKSRALFGAPHVLRVLGRATRNRVRGARASGRARARARGGGRAVACRYVKLHVMSSAIHYGQAVYEGAKAHHCADGEVRLWNVGANAARARATRAVLHVYFNSGVFERSHMRQERACP